MTTTADLLTELNTLRTEYLGKPALKAWKESRAKLEAVLVVTRQAAEPYMQNGATCIEEADIEEAAPTPPINVVAVNGAPVEYVRLADLARECGVNPKVARAKMRRSGRWQAFGSHKYAVQHRAEIVDFLKGVK